MIRRLFILLFTALLAACSNDGNDPDPGAFNLSQSVARLRSTAGATAAVTVESNGDWLLTTQGSDYTISPTSGHAGKSVVTITSTLENPQRARRSLGSVVFRQLSDNQQLSLEVVQSPAQATHTMLLYMPGVTLLGYYKNNIEGIKKAVNAHMPGDGRILICYQPNGLASAELSEIRYDAQQQTCVIEPLKSYPSFRTSTQASVQELLADVASEAPAQSYGLIIGTHGKAWVPASERYLNTLSLRPYFEDIWKKAPGALPTRSFGDVDFELDVKQLAAAIEAQSYELEYLLFDACFMANIETLYDLRTSAPAIIASPCEIMATGFPYEQSTPHLFADDGARRDLENVCWEFWNYYQSQTGLYQSGCISLCKTEYMESLADVVKRINAAPKKQYDHNTLQSYEGMPNHLFFDLGHLVELTCTDAALKAEFEEAMDRAFPRSCRLNTPQFYSGVGRHGQYPINYYSGVTLSEPSNKYVELNRQTTWYVRTH